MEDNKKIEYEFAKLVISTYHKIAIWNNSEFDTTIQKQDALKVVSQDIVQSAMDELAGMLNLKTRTEVMRGDVRVGDIQAIKDTDSFKNVNEDDILSKLLDKK